jgi:hypothetical protein
VSLIVASEGPLGPRFHGFVTRRERYGVYTVEPVRVEGRYVA